MKSPDSAARRLAMLAQTQGGYFTAKQAASVGYGYRHLDYHETVGNFERIAHGLYRLPTVPVAEHDDLIRLTFWSRNQKDEPQAVVSHESALALHELTDILPNYVHLTVPRTFRKRTPNGCKLHKSTLESNETEEREGFSVTTPLRTLLDAATSGVSQEQLNLAVRDAIERGLIRRKALEDAARTSAGAARLTRGLRKQKGIKR
jgi:predicted transcriptional regulator of viral defense system